MPLIIGAKSAAAEAHTVDNSCRFNDDDSSQLQVTNGTATDNQKWTCSFWIKVGRGAVGVAGCLMAAKSGSPYFYLYIDDVYRINFYGQDKDGSNDVAYVTNRLFRDPSAWYHIVAAMDSTLAAAGDRFRIYVNGVEETSFSTETDPTQNKIYPINYTGFAVNVASRDDDVNPYDGYMAEVCLIDGQQLTPSSFGEFDSSSPTIWKPKDPSELTFGNNGFYLDFEDSADLGADVSGNSNDLTVTNLDATDQATDTPTNNFCTLNPLWEHGSSTVSDGNLIFTGASGATGNTNAIGSLGATKGKWYYEAKRVAGYSAYPFMGVCDSEGPMGDYVGASAYSWGILMDGGNNGKWRHDGSMSTADLGTFANGDIGMVAFDMDNGKIWFGINGTWGDSGDPSAGTGEQYSNLTGTIIPAVSIFDHRSIISVNFGNPPYANSSDAADADGYGAFEYTVPTGFYALCTKNLAEYG